MKRLISFLLAFSLLSALPCLTGCGARPPKEHAPFYPALQSDGTPLRQEKPGPSQPSLGDEPIRIPEGELPFPAQGTIDPDKPMVALSFDDGPYAPVTNRILDTLRRHGARATFFVVGNRVDDYAGTLRRAVEEGHEIGIHTWSHAKLTKLSADGIRQQVLDTYHAVLNTAGYQCAVVRPPGGSYNQLVRNTIGAEGFYLANWSVDTEDWRSRDADSVYQEIMSAVEDGCIILCHDLYPTTADAMERVIPDLIGQGYQIVSVSELLQYKQGSVEAGRLYRHG